MASRRRRPTATNLEPVAEAQPTHEEMLEIAEDREAQVEETPEEEEQAIEVLMSMALADTFEAIYKAEEEHGVEDFFEPTPAPAPTPVVIHPPAEVVPPRRKATPNHNIQRVITRQRKS